MKVNQTGNNSNSNEATGVRQGGKSQAAHEAKKSQQKGVDEADRSNRSGANAEISKKSKDFAQAKAVATSTPDVRDERVAELKRRVSEGSYRVDNAAVADRMVDEHLGMPGD